jgi:hypothetical protein
MAMDIEGQGKIVRVKSGGVVTLLLFLTLLVVCSQNYVNDVTPVNGAGKRAKTIAGHVRLAEKTKTPLEKPVKSN